MSISFLRKLMRACLSQRQGVFTGVAVLVATLLVTTTAITGVDATSVELQPFAWGGVSPSTDKTKYSTWGSLAMGDVAMTNLTSSSPSGGGASLSPVTADGPAGKLRWLRAFAGATPLFFSEGGTANHVLTAVETSAGAHQLWAWGDNSKGQLGIGTTTSFAQPVKVAWTPAEAGETITYLAAGLSHSLMVTTTNGRQRLYAWGLNTSGQLGDGTLTQRLTPTLISLSPQPTFVSIAAGSAHSVAADSTGAVWVWGCDGAQTATSLACGDLGLYGTRFVVVPTKLTDTSVNSTTMSIVSRSYVDTTNIATFSLNQPGGFAVGDPIAISLGNTVLDTSFQQVKEYSRTGTTATVYFDDPHHRQVGDSVYVRGLNVIHSTTALVVITAVPTSDSFQFTSGTSGDIAVTTTSTGYVFDRVVKTASTNVMTSSFTTYATQTRSTSVSGDITVENASQTVTHRGLSTTTSAQLWFAGPHNFVTGNSIVVTGVDDDGSPQLWDGTFTVTSVGTTAGNYWVKYTVPSQASTIAQQSISSAATVAFAESSFDASAVSYTLTSNLVTVTTTNTHGLKVGNIVTVDLDGTRYDKQSIAIATVPTASSFTFRLHAAIASASTSGTARIIGCFELCPTAPTGVLEVAAGEGFVVARTATGVWTWGSAFTNNYGRLGRTSPTATATTRFGQVVLPAINDAGTSRVCTPASVTAGPANVAVHCDVDGGQDTVVAWGHATYGRTGAGTTSVTTTTLAQLTPTEVKACVTCAHNGTTTTLGTVGHTGFDQNGYVTLGRALGQGEDIVQIEQNAAGGFALTDTGRIFSWGSNIGRVLGNSRTYETSDQSTKELYSKAARIATRVQPVNSAGQPVGIRSMVADGNCAHILDMSDVVWSWGSCGGTGVTAYLSGRGTMGSYAPSGTLLGTKTGLKFDRIDVPSSARIMSIETMYRNTFILVNSADARDEVSLWVVGHRSTEISDYITNYVGDASDSSYLLPAKIDLPFGFDTVTTSRKIDALSCGEMHCLLTTNDNRIFGWGDVRTGSSTVNTGAVLPSQRTTGSPAYYGYIIDITSELTTAIGVASFVDPQVSAGTNFSLIVDVGASGGGGTVYGWGHNLFRRASSAVSTATIGPTAVTNATDAANHVSMNDIVSISAGGTHSVAVRADGSIVLWGSDQYGQLGDGTTSGKYFSAPALPSGRVAVRAIAAGGYTMVQLDDGSLLGFGLNRRGVLGNGNITNQVSPVSVQGGLTFASFDTAGNLNNQGTSSAVGVTTSGDVYSWGANEYGQIGRGGSLSSTTYSSVPVRVLQSSLEGIGGVDSVVAAGAWSAAYGRYEPLTVPSPPTALSAVGGDQSVTLSWTPPSPRLELASYEIAVTANGVTQTLAAGAGALSITIPALSNGTAYSIAMRSVNRVGKSSLSSAVTATPFTIPGPPTELVVTPSQGAIDATWSVPASNGGSEVLDYTVTVHDSGDDPSVDSPVVTETLAATTTRFDTTDGLINGNAYDVRVSARNANGSSATTASVTGVVPGRPSAPIGVTVAGRPSTALISWSAPASDGGAAIRSYVVRAYVVGSTTVVAQAVVSQATLSHSSLSLVNGTSYDITVAASQADGPSDENAAIAAQGSESQRIVVVAGRPNAPTGAPLVTAGNGSLTLVWQPVADVAGIAVTHYKVRAVGPSTVTTATISAVDAQCATTCTSTISSLANGIPYEVSVAAGVGSQDAEFGLYGTSATSTPRTVPGTPTNLVTERGSESLDVSWDPPLSDGGAAITSFEITVTGGGDTVTRTVGARTVATSIGELVNGVTYSVEVVAVNNAGESVTPATATQKVFTVPDAPLVTSIGPASSTLSTTRKASDGQTATLTFASATNLNEGDVVDVSGLGESFDGTDISVVSVTTSSPFTISYVAQNDVEVSDTSAVGVVRLAGIYVEWDAPLDGGDTITSYNISVTDGVNSATYLVSAGAVKLSDGVVNATGATTSDCVFSQRSCTITKIESLNDSNATVNVVFSNGSSYVLSISAVNAAGAGAPAEPSIVVGQPDNPRSIGLTADESQFSICWADPLRIPAGRTIQAYRINVTYQSTTKVRTVSADEVLASASCNAPQVGIIVDRFDDGSIPVRGVQHSVSIAASVSPFDAVQNFGAISTAASVTPLGVADAPTLSNVVISGTSAQVSWSAPTNTGGQTILRYDVTSQPDGLSCSTSTTTCVVANLRRGVTYQLRVTSVNASGNSEFAETTSFVIESLPTPTTVPATSNSVAPTTTVPLAVSPWTSTKVKGSIGGFVLISSTVNSSASFSVKSREITVWLRKGPTGGKVAIRVNGKLRRTVDVYAPKTGSMAVTVTSTTKAKVSVVNLSVLSSKNRKSKGRVIGLDAISPLKTCGKGCIKNPAAPQP